ncbi:MAG: hypothetical protein ACKO6N_23955 [Myxococcota bacterium]
MSDSSVLPSSSRASRGAVVPVPLRSRDTRGKQVLRILAAPREVETETEHTPVLRTDVTIRPGPSLPPETGLLGELMGEKLSLVELFAGRPTLSELWHVRAKGLLSLERLSGVLPRHPPLPQVQLMLTLGAPRAALARAFGALDQKVVEAGLTYYYDAYELVHVDLLRLPVRLDTAWLHIMGSSEGMKLAFDMLLKAGRKADLRWIHTFFQEVHGMAALPSSLAIPSDIGSNPEVYHRWELSLQTYMAHLKGLAEGKAEGKAEGERLSAQADLQLILELRFGPLSPHLSGLIQGIQAPEQLRALMPLAVKGSLDELETRARELSLSCSL